MAIIKKADLQRDIKELDIRFNALRKAVIGSNPNQNIFNLYSNNPEQYQQEFTEVNAADVEYAISDFHAVLKRLGSIEKLKANPLSKIK